MVFAHGFGCDQNMWRLVAPAFASDHRVVLFDHIGSGSAAADAYDARRHASLDGYALDVLELLQHLDLRDVIFVGHSVSAMIGALASLRDPSRFAKLVMIGPSPCYVDDKDYRGGFSAGDIEELLASLDSNYLGWSRQMAPVIMGNADRPELGEELTSSFCRTDPELARRFAEVTFRSDNRLDLAQVVTPTLVVQCTDDVIAPVVVGEYVRDRVRHGSMALLEATGHCPHLSAPEETIQAIRAFLGD